ncbi:MAG: DUF179 domain-containing protein [Gammaproteobacteria bacterium]|nr:DUF179 domain-containing protein [Gammaproteobacteria bacterium]
MSAPMALANNFLVALPSVNDIIFSQALIYICEHHERGTVGMIVNRPTGHPASLMFEQLGISTQMATDHHIPLLFGGPIQADRGFVMHRPTGHWQSSLSLVPDEVTITTSNDIIRAIADGTGPKDLLIVMGYVGWENGELEREIVKQNAWIVCPYKSELLYEVPYAERWKAAAQTLGVNMDNLTDLGHA